MEKVSKAKKIEERKRVTEDILIKILEALAASIAFFVSLFYKLKYRL